MTSVPLPPAPPPPPPPLNSAPKNQTGCLYNKSVNNNYLQVCKWTNHVELSEACFKNNICRNVAPFKHKYKHFAPIIQIGPTCGLVALSMLEDGEVTPDEILNIAKMEGYTSIGEMLSCKDMVKLSEKVLSLAELQDITCSLIVGGLCSDDIVEKLLDGALLLVPYDADCNHSPCLKQGHTAHWALICGVIVISDIGDSYTSDPGNVYVLARHGKSKYVAAWRLEELGKSNKNLWEFSPKKEADGLVYVLPEGGVGGKYGLRNQFLIVESLK